MPQSEPNPKHPVNRAIRTAKLVLKDAIEAIACHACFVAANEEVRALSPDRVPIIFANAATFNVAIYAQLTYMALMLGRLFDPGKPGIPLKDTDIASVPVLMRYLAIKEVQHHFVDKARGWMPDSDIEDIHAQTVEGAIRDGLDEWATFEGSSEGSRTLENHKRYRNKVLAHTLDLTKKGTPPIVNDLHRLFDNLIPHVGRIALIFDGQHWDPADRHPIAVSQGRAFWREALRANFEAMHGK